MSNIAKLCSIPEKLAEENRLRIIAQRALAPSDFPFDGLDIEAAMILNQLSLATSLSAPNKSKASTDKRDDPKLQSS